MSTQGTRRVAPRANPTDRRRASWGEFRRSYPGILATMAVALATMLILDGWLMYKRVRYEREVERLRGGMTAFERQKADMILAADEHRLSVMLELIRRQSLGDKRLHLGVAVDSGRMFLERDGARLREMPVQVGPEKTVGVAPDTVRMVRPRGTRTVERVLTADDSWEVPAWVYTDRGLAVPAERGVKGALGPAAVLLSGGAVLYAPPSAGPLNDPAYVLPGSVRAREADLRAILPNVQPGMTVYFY
jgi:hypothetical protein